VKPRECRTFSVKTCDPGIFLNTVNQQRSNFIVKILWRPSVMTMNSMKVSEQIALLEAGEATWMQDSSVKDSVPPRDVLFVWWFYVERHSQKESQSPPCTDTYILGTQWDHIITRIIISPLPSLPLLSVVSNESSFESRFLRNSSVSTVVYLHFSSRLVYDLRITSIWEAGKPARFGLKRKFLCSTT
jgi:hypothetical protein